MLFIYIFVFLFLVSIGLSISSFVVSNKKINCSSKCPKKCNVKCPPGKRGPIGLQGSRGERGPIGLRGPPGSQGERGPAGTKFNPIRIDSGTKVGYIPNWVIFYNNDKFVDKATNCKLGDYCYYTYKE